MWRDNYRDDGGEMTKKELLSKAKKFSEELALEKYPVAYSPSGSADLTYDANYASRNFFIETFLDGVQFAINENEIERATCCLANEEENQKLKRQLEVCRVSLEEVGRVRYGLSFEDSDEEAADYWADLAIEYRDRARQALAELEKMK